jgi:hypothetical protein
MYSLIVQPWLNWHTHLAAKASQTMPMTGLPPPTALSGDSTFAGSWMLKVTLSRNEMPSRKPMLIVARIDTGPAGEKQQHRLSRRNGWAGAVTYVGHHSARPCSQVFYKQMVL